MKNWMRPLCFAVVAGAAFAVGAQLRADAPIPTEDSAIVSKLVDQLGADDPVDRENAGIALEDRPDWDLPLVEAADQRDGLSPEQKTRLHSLLSRMEPRSKAHARLQAFNSKVLAWRSKVAGEYYAKDGHTHPSWDDAAKQAIELDGRRDEQLSPSERIKLVADERMALGQALAAGCNDPDLLAIAGTFYADTHAGQDRDFSMFHQALEAAADGKVSPEALAVIAGRILRARAEGLDGGISHINSQPTGTLLTQMVQSYLQACKRPDIPPEMVIAMADSILNTSHLVHARLKPIFDDVDPPLEKAAPNDSRTLTFKGLFYIYYAWEARGDGLGNTVTPQGWKDFADRLDTANDLLIRAWQQDPANFDAPTDMLTVALGQEWPMTEVQKWYQRAMDANPDDYRACTSMLYYLEPKWHGSPEAMVEFGHQCLQTRNWHGRLPFILVEAHVSAAKYATNQAQYYQSDAVWSDISTVYSEYLDAYPTSDQARTQYARYACICGRWPEANDLFNKLGDKADPNVFGSAAALQQLKERAASEAKAAKGQ